MKPRAGSGWRCWLRRAGLLGLAVLLVIAAMVDYCLSTVPQGVGIRWQVAVLLTCAALLVFLPLARKWKLFFRDLAVALVPAFVAVVAYANVAAVWASHGRIYNDVSKVPPTEIGLVFGTTSHVNGRENLYFRYRIDAAADLWNAGKIKTLIVSGDNQFHDYNEPEKMRRALVKRGIPEDRIVRDHAGFRTLDSVVRAKEVFGADRILFISQRFQTERAIYLAKAKGIEGYGFDAKDVETRAGMKTKIREVGARVKMWLDVNFLNTRPKHLGEKVELPQ